MTFLDALEAASPADLDEMTAAIAAAQKQLDGLRCAEKLLRARLGAPRAPDAPKANGHAPGNHVIAAREGFLADRLRVAQYLLHSGPTKPASLMENLALKSSRYYRLIDDAMFLKEGDGRITLTNEGRQLAGGNQ